MTSTAPTKPLLNLWLLHLQELQKQWEAMQVDRGLLMHQLSAEQDNLKADQVKLEDAK